MPWSTRQLADLAGTTVRAVRHYHHIGLLAEPVRQSNGYKQYGVDHLLRLVRIKRLAELGFTLPQIADMGELETLTADAVRTLDAELAESIDRMQQIRDELATLQQDQVPTDLPPELAAVSGDLSEADRSLVVVVSRMLGPSGIDAYTQLLRYTAQQDPQTDPTPDFDALPADADDEAREDLAERMYPSTVAMLRNNPALQAATAESPRGERYFARTLGEAVQDLYNPAQLDVLARLGRLLNERGAGG